jgi:hypothetical protein
MKMILIAKETNAVIDVVDVDFLPEIGEVMVYKDLEPEEKLYQVEKYLKPTLFKDGDKNYKTVLVSFVS